MRQSRTRSLGMDVHQDSMAVAYVAHEPGAEGTSLGTIGTRQGDMDQRIRRRPSQATQLLCLDDAGPWGSWLDRDLTPTGDDCWVVAPSRMPPTPGERVNTDRRDAGHLARLARSGARTAVDGPQVDEAARRARRRARADTSRALPAATCRLQACWRRHERRSTGRATGGPAHLRWRSAVVGPTPPPPIVLQADVRAVHEPTARRQRLDHALHDQGNSWRWPPVVDALQALRGVPFPVAVTLVAELGERTRVDPPRELMNGWGLIPSDSSSGEPRRQGALTTAGHAQARRALVEGAWASRDPAKGSRHLHLRLEPPPTVLQDRSWQAQVRLCTRDRRRVSRGTHPHVGTGAMARELAGCMGAMATPGPVTPSSPDA